MTANAITLAGYISYPVFSHSVYGEDFYTLDIRVKRLSGEEDCLPVTFARRYMCAPLKGLMHCRITGQLRSYNYIENEKRRLLLSVYAHSVLPMQEEIFENEITLTGYICKPPVFRITPFAREITDVLLAVNRAYGKSDYIPCIAWGKNAHLTEKMPVGTRVSVTGRLQSRQYQKKQAEGVTESKTAFEVSVSKIAPALDG